jgi:hypothetical protein
VATAPELRARSNKKNPPQSLRLRGGFRCREGKEGSSMDAPSTLPLDELQEPTQAPAPAPRCEQCGEEFEPRATGKGGKAQRFCSRKCRNAYNYSQRLDQTPNAESSDTPNAESSADEDMLDSPVPVVAPEVTAPEPEPDESDSREFDWDADHTVIASQPAIATYWNVKGAVVIRQEGDPDAFFPGDNYVWLLTENLPKLIGRLQQMLKEANGN